MLRIVLLLSMYNEMLVISWHSLALVQVGDDVAGGVGDVRSMAWL